MIKYHLLNCLLFSVGLLYYYIVYEFFFLKYLGQKYPIIYCVKNNKPFLIYSYAFFSFFCNLILTGFRCKFIDDVWIFSNFLLILDYWLWSCEPCSSTRIIQAIKQFVVTNCSKERPGSIVTKTLKNWILISIATSKESHFYADFKYISFIKFSLTHQKLGAWENLPYLGK